MGTPSLISNFSWTAFGNVTYAISQWGIVAILAKLGSPEMVGRFALASAIATPIIQFLNLQLRGVQATDANREYLFRDYLALRSCTTVLALIALVVVAFIGDYPPEVKWVLIIVSVAKSADALSDVFYGYFQQKEDMKFISIAQMANGVLSLVFMGAAVWWTGSLVPGVLGYALASITVLLAFVIPAQLRHPSRDPICTENRPIVTVGTLYQLARMALPLGFAMLLISLNSNVPRIIIERTQGEAELGVFAALMYLVVAGTVVVSALGQAASPRLSQHFAANEHVEFRNLLLSLMLLGLGIGLVGSAVAWFGGEIVLSILYTSAYADYSDVLVLISIAAGFTFAASFAGYAMTAAREFRIQVPVFSIVAAVSLIASLLLIPPYGLMGAAGVVLITSIVQLGAESIVVVRALQKRSEVRG